MCFAPGQLRLFLPQGKYLLQGAAASVLGRQLVQYAKHVGVKTINVVRRSEHIQELKDLGCASLWFAIKLGL